MSSPLPKEISIPLDTVVGNHMPIVFVFKMYHYLIVK
jgi:hypothetical protein